MTRWNHAHSIATGLVFGLVLDREALIVFVLGVAIGVVSVIASRYARRATSFVREQASRISAARAEAHAAKTALDLAEAERKRAAAAELASRAEHRVRTAREQEAAVRTAYIRGAADDEHHRELWLDGARS